MRLPHHLALVVLLAAIGIALLPSAGVARSGDTGSVAVLYHQGWNIVAGSGAAFSDASVPLFSYQAETNEYQQLAQGAVLSSGLGYWGYFEHDSDVIVPSGGELGSISLPPNRWVLVGRPAFAGPEIRGADRAYTYDAATMAYRQATSLLVGQGAWVFSYGGGTLSLAYPGAPPP